AAVLAFDVGSFTTQKLGRHHAAADGVANFAAAGVVDDRFAVIFTTLTANLREERCKAVVVVHRPAVERMIVALGALGLDAHEDLGHVLAGFQRVTFDLVEVGGRVLERTAVGG